MFLMILLSLYSPCHRTQTFKLSHHSFPRPLGLISSYALFLVTRATWNPRTPASSVVTKTFKSLEVYVSHNLTSSPTHADSPLRLLHPVLCPKDWPTYASSTFSSYFGYWLDSVNGNHLQKIGDRVGRMRLVYLSFRLPPCGVHMD